MESREIIGTSVLLAILIIAAIYDWKYKKIPNGLVFPGMIAGMVITYSSPRALLFTFCFLVALFFLGMLDLMGLGDIKLWMVITTFIGIIHSSIVMVIGMALMIADHIVRKRKLVMEAAKNIVRRTVGGRPTDAEAAGYKAALAPYILWGYIILEGWFIIYAHIN